MSALASRGGNHHCSLFRLLIRRSGSPSARAGSVTRPGTRGELPVNAAAAFTGSQRGSRRRAANLSSDAGRRSSAGGRDRDRWRAASSTVEVAARPARDPIRRGGRAVIDGSALFDRRTGSGERPADRADRGRARRGDARAAARGRRRRRWSSAPRTRPRCELEVAGEAPASCDGRGSPRADRVELELEPARRPFRLGAGWAAGAGRAPDRARRAPRRALRPGAAGCVRLGADRRYTGPDCPPEMLAEGGIPQGDYVPGARGSARAPAGRCGSRPGAPGVEFDLARRRRDLAARRRRAAAPAPALRPDAGGAPAPLPAR